MAQMTNVAFYTAATWSSLEEAESRIFRSAKAARHRKLNESWDWTKKSLK